MPPVGSSKRRQWVLKTLVRRGTAYAQVSQFEAAYTDLKDASELDPDNEALKQDLAQLEEVVSKSAK